jgi:RimJ/RimL family protein N-acetyltransferase
MLAPSFSVRPAEAADVEPLIDLYEAVASEGKWIGGELPVDRQRWRQGFVDSFLSPEDSTMLVAATDDRLIGNTGVQGHGGVGELGMMVAADWRGKGVGSALLAEAIGWARASGLHKIALQVWPHNDGARQLYRKFGFVEEGYLRRHYRRRNGQLWDAVMMALILDETSPGRA